MPATFGKLENGYMKLAMLLCSASAMLQAQSAASQSYPPVAVIQRVEPEYSGAARAAGLQGTATVYVEVTPAGAPDNIQVAQGLGMGLDEKAIAAVKQWTFKPATENGAPVRSALAVEVRFQLPGAAWAVRRATYAVQVPNKSRLYTAIVEPVLREYEPPSPAACKNSPGGAALQFAIGPDGVPRDIHPFDPLHASGSRNGAVDSTVAAAVGAWRFQAGILFGKPDASQATVELGCGNRPAAGQTPLQLGGGVQGPELVYKVEPEYTEAAHKAKRQGMVILYVVVDETGHTGHLAIRRLLGAGLDEKAMEAVLRWRFRPATNHGDPVAVAATVEVNFKLL